MELARFPSRGGFSLRSILTFVLTVVMAAFLSVLFTTSTPVKAADPIANWSGDAIVYDTHGYTSDDQFVDATGTIPSGATVYKSPVQTSGNGGTPKIFILYFSPGVDPPTATSVQYVEFDYANGTTSNPANAKTVTLTLKGQEDPLSSCSIEGVGWIICPMSVFLAGAMDSLFNILSSMIAVQPPILGDPNNSLYMAWDITQGIANIAFVIVFLIIIYAQLTHMWVSNYGLKRLLPRLIVAAVLVNISFYISAAAIDVSNILGYSVQDVFNGIREHLFRMTNDTSTEAMTDTTWTTIAGVVLAGGGVIGGLYYMATGGLYFLLSLLVGIVLIALFVVIILAARQAIIILLVIVAPLAFVANLLPNTEKWFGKWKDLFMTMLIFFPAFSLVFGGSQLAGQIIIQNAGDNIVMLLFGLAVQVAPLVITPLILKFSGGLLGRIAQIANDPRKALYDRSKRWATDRAEHAKQQNIARGPRLRNPASWGAGLVRNADFRKRRLSDNTDVWKQRATNRYNQTRKYGHINERMADAELQKEAIHNEHAAHIENLKRTPNTAIHASAMRVQVSKDSLETGQNNLNAYYNRQRIMGSTALNTSMQTLEASKLHLETSEGNKTAYITTLKSTRGTQLHQQTIFTEQAKQAAQVAEARFTRIIDEYKTGLLDPTTLTDVERAVMDQMTHDSAVLSAEKQGAAAAQYEIQRNISTIMTGTGPLTNELLDIAQSVGGDVARVRAQAQAVATKNKLDSDALSAGVELLKNEALQAGSTIKRYSANLVAAKEAGDTEYGGIEITPERLKSALQAQAEEKNIPLFERLRGNKNFDQALISEIIANNAPAFKGAGGFHLQDNPALNIDNYATREEFNAAMRFARIQSLANASASGLSGVKYGWLGEFADPVALRENIDAALAQPDGDKFLRMAYTNVREALTNPDIRAAIGDREDEIRAIEAALAQRFGEQPTPDDRPPIVP